jgi:NAD(P)-dependent dehydrogenase (short-subunit alcohol dehydrogenase family)
MGSTKSYLIVGASGAIGSAVASALAGTGTCIGLHYCKNVVAATALKSRLDAAGSTSILLQSDIADERDCNDLVKKFVTAAGPPSGIALCGGSINWKPWDQLDPRTWQQTLFEHCIAPYLIALAAVGAMEKKENGRIVFLSSIAPKYGGSAMTIHYAAAKAALEAAMRGLAKHVANTNLRVNGVRAGFVDTPLQRNGRTPDEIASRISKIPVGRAGTPDEVASAIVYLLSVPAKFITGELLTVAGGD